MITARALLDPEIGRSGPFCSSPLRRVAGGEPSLAQAVKILLERIERLEARILSERDAGELLTGNQVDKRYHLRRGTAAAHARAGTVKCRVYRRGARECYKIPLAEAERKWGAS